jgi:hypothetical protein
MRIPLRCLHPLPSWQRALAAIRRERGNLVPSAGGTALARSARHEDRAYRRISTAIPLAARAIG